MALQRLKEEAEKAKIELSSAQEDDINLPFITADRPARSTSRTEAHPREARSSSSDDLFERTIGPCKTCLKDAGADARREINELVLVGGMTRMPKVHGDRAASSSARSRTRA